MATLDRPPLALVIDDDPDAREIHGVHLQDMGYDVVKAPGGRSGLAHAARRTPDLILLDLMMPGITGHDVLTILRDQSWGKRIPVVVVSAVYQRGNDLVRDVQRLGAVFMSKGGRIRHELPAAILEASNGSRRFRVVLTCIS